jgi:hypothetical protein
MRRSLFIAKKITAPVLIFIMAATFNGVFLPEAISASSQYSVEASVPQAPRQLQEGDSASIKMKVIAGKAGSTYVVGINVTDPANITNTASKLIETNATGYGETSVVYPTDFGPLAHTNYTGSYQISASFNQTAGTATDSFIIGITNATQYGKLQVLNIRATNYTQPYTPRPTPARAWINITTGGQTVFFSNTSAVKGIIEANWTIPSNAALGTYSVSITNSTQLGAVKPTPDKQTFLIVRTVYSAKFKTQDINEDPLVGASVKVNSTLSKQTNMSGWAEFLLDADIYRVEVYWKNVGVFPMHGARGADFIINQNITQILVCRVTNLAITVKDMNQQPLPSINISVASNYTTVYSERTSFETNSTGTIYLRNSLVDASYIIEASRYESIFKSTFISKLPEQSWVNITIIAPKYTASIKVLDSKNESATDLTVSAYEWSSGVTAPAESAITDTHGNVILNLTFGKYRIRVYNSTVLLNETTILILTNSSLVIYCSIYRADLQVIITDYFGRPIPGAIIIVEQKRDSQYIETMRQTTKPNGVASFEGIIGGDSYISVLVSGRVAGNQSIYIAGSKEVVFKMTGYIVVAGYVLETNQFIALVILTVLIIAFIVVLTYKRILRFPTKKKA